MLLSQKLVVLSVQAKEFFLVLIRHRAYINVWPLSHIAEPQHTSRRRTVNQVGAGRILARIYLKCIILPRLLVVVHLDSRVMFFDRTS